MRRCCRFRPSASAISISTPRPGRRRTSACAQAIAYAIDRQTLIDALLQGFWSPVNILGAQPIFGYTDKVEGYPFDPRQGARLDQGSGCRKGRRSSSSTSPAYDRSMVEAIQQMLNDVGLSTEITSLDQATFLKRRQGDAKDAGSVALGRWSCACQDADGIIFPLFRTGSSWAKYSNPQFDSLVDDARSTLDNGKRLADYQKAYEILREDVPGIGLYQSGRSLRRQQPSEVAAEPQRSHVPSWT